MPAPESRLSEFGRRKRRPSNSVRGLPAAHPRPLSFDCVAYRGDDMVPLVLRRRRAGVIGQDSEFRADREVGQSFGRSGPDGENAVLLARLLDDQVRIELGGQIADEAVTLVDPLRRGAAIT